MNFKTLLACTAVVTAMPLITSCSDDEPENEPKPETIENVAGEVFGTWTKGSTINISGHITVPEGKSLVIEEGVTIVMDPAGVGVSHTPIEMVVEGNLYSKGTENSPITFTVPESYRKTENAFVGLWGGIIATEKCDEMLIDNTIIEYTGGPVNQDSPSAIKGIYTPGDDFAPQITTNNVDGRYVIINSVLRYGASDAIYMMGGKAVIANNIFAGNGKDGGEAVNVKAGCQVDVAGNIMYSPNTNGLKLSSSGQNDEGGRTQAKIRAYNNTIINAGWRRDGTKGGCVYVEKNALASVFNNLMVNCKFRAMEPNYKTPDDPEEGLASQSVIDYNFYTSGTASSDLAQDIEEGTLNPYLGYTLENKKYGPSYDTHSIVSASAGDEGTNPMFVNFPYMTNSLLGYEYNTAWDFHVAAGSPVLSGAYSGNDDKMQPYFGSGIVVNGSNYTSPAPKAYFGAFGTK